MVDVKIEDHDMMLMVMYLLYANGETSATRKYHAFSNIVQGQL